MRRERRILILGKRPPPIGGVTTHVARLCEWMTHKAVPFYYLDIAESGIIDILLALRRHRAVHLHGTNPFFLLLVSIWSKLTDTSMILTFHGDIFSFRGFKASILRMALRWSAMPIMLNQTSYEAAKLVNSNARLMSAFIPPLQDELLAPEIAEEIRLRARGRKWVVVTYAYDLAFDVNGNEIYGITDVINCISTTDHLLVVSDPSGNYKKFAYEQINPDLLSNVLFVSQPHSLYAVLAFADVFIRNTTTDGDALSVHEALFLEKRVLATDCVPRPLGVQTYTALGEVQLNRLMDQPNSRTYTPPSVVDELAHLYRTF